VTPSKDLTFDRRQMAALYRLGKLVRASMDLDATLAAIAAAASELTGAELTAILLLVGDHLVIHAARGALASAIGERVPAASGVAGRAMRERRTVLVADMLNEPNRARPDLDAATATRGYIAAPLEWRGESLGCVTVGSIRPGALGPGEATLVEELAGHAAAAVAHARAYAGEQRLRAASQATTQQLREQTSELERAQQQLVQNEKLAAIGELAHGVAHEINTPLGVIMSNLSVLARYGTALCDVASAARQTVAQLRGASEAVPLVEALDASLQRADLDFILGDLPQLTHESLSSAERIATIVRSMATFARRDSEQTYEVDVEEVLEAAVTLAWNVLKHRAQIVRDFTPLAPVMGHASELTQVFVHLLLNAVQAVGDRPGSILIRTRREAGGISVRVTDNGSGISAEHLLRVFDPFFTTRPPGLGTGMGLAVCHGIVTRHDGTIQLHSTPGQGTTVSVWLPEAESVAEAA
jgi:signal transduction histidine kinase